jgi:hypothetical protein
MLSEQLHFVPLMNSANVSTGADCDSFNMAGYHKATIIFSFGTVTTDITLTPMSGATNAAKTTAIPTMYASAGAVIGTAVAASTASCDVLAAWTASTTTISITAASNKFVAVEIKASDLTEGHNWVTITVAAGTSGICHAIAVLQPRFKTARGATALA